MTITPIKTLEDAYILLSLPLSGESHSAIACLFCCYSWPRDTSTKTSKGTGEREERVGLDDGVSSRSAGAGVWRLSAVDHIHIHIRRLRTASSPHVRLFAHVSKKISEDLGYRCTNP
eukprot:scaffold233092_cov37-Tisochrysis_lutea.AAC.1